MNSTDIYILGAGGQARVILSIIQQTQVYKPLGVFDLSYSGNDEEIMGVPVLGGLGDLEGLIEKNNGINLSLAIGDNNMRKTMFEKFSDNEINIPSLISNEANIDQSIKQLGKGNIFSPFVHIGPDCVLGDNNIFNTRSTIEHECKVGSHNHIAPHSLILGRSVLDSNIFLGANSTVLPSFKICSKVTIGANSLVVSDINIEGTYVGAPVRKMEK